MANLRCAPRMLGSSLAWCLVPDPIFEHPRLVAIYDALDPDRSDLDVYAVIASELGARHILDLGCGTGTFALQLACRPQAEGCPGLVSFGG